MGRHPARQWVDRRARHRIRRQRADAEDLDSGQALNPLAEQEMRRLFDLGEEEDGEGKTIYIAGNEDTSMSADVQALLEQQGFLVQRIGGPSRDLDDDDPEGQLGNLETARALSDAIVDAQANEVDTALVATRTSYADALAMAGVAARNRWPLLYTEPDGALPFDTCRWLVDNPQVETVHIAGGTQAISQGIEDQIRDGCGRNEDNPRDGTRLGGATRIETAIQIAEFFFPLPRGLAIANAGNYPDALTGASLSRQYDGPILLTFDNQELEPELRAYLCAQAEVAGTAFILGGAQAISPDIEQQVAAAGAGACDDLGPRVPAPPSSASAAPGDGSAEIMWTESPDDGGSAITNYIIEARQASDDAIRTVIDAGAGERSAVIQGLTNGTAYYFNVRARNSQGDSGATRTNTVTPSGGGQAGDEILWGVDSSFSHIDMAMIEDVRSTYGDPEMWGRYLGAQDDEGGKSLEVSEVTLAHENGIAIGLFYFDYAADLALEGYDTGQELAQEALQFAAGAYDGPDAPPVPAGTAIVVDHEPGIPVDDLFIQGWYDTIAASPYRPGYYGNVGDADDRPEGQSLEVAFCDAVASQPEIAAALLWTPQPQHGPGRTGPEDAPEYAPATPACAEQPQAWQYAINEDNDDPVVDTNLVRANMGLWHPPGR